MSKPRIRKVGSLKNWQIVWHENGNTKRKSTGTEDFTEAQAELEAFIEERGGRRPEKNLVPQILDAYIEMRSPLIKSEVTLEYRAKPLKRAFPKRLPSMIRQEHTLSYAEKRRSRGVSNSTINSELSLLRSALKYAYNEGWIRKMPNIALPRPNPPKERWLKKDEAHKLLGASRAFHLKLFCLIALNTAARRGAIQDLMWDQVDLENRLINFNQAGRVQTSKRRPTLPINNALYDALLEAQERATSDYVVEYAGKKVGKINRAFQRAAARAGLTGVTPHTLRHTCATWMAQAGVSLYEIAGILDHSDIKTTYKHYAKHHPEHMREGMAVLDRVWKLDSPKRRGKRNINMAA